MHASKIIYILKSYSDESDPDLPLLLFLRLFQKKSLLEAIIHGVWGGVDPFVTIYFKFHSLSAFP